MNTLIRTIVFATALGPFSWAGDPAAAFNPATHPVERYQHIWEKSPFVTEAPVVRESGGLAQRFLLTGVASLQNQPVIFVLDRQSLSRLVVTGVRNQQGLELVSVESQTDPKQSCATIRLGTEQAVIRYDPAALQGVNQLPETQKTTGAGPATAPAPANAAPRAVKVIKRSKPINLAN